MKRLMPFVLLIAVASSFMSFDFAMKQPRWEKLGQRMVNMKADHDVIPVTIAEGTFTAVRFRVLKAPIHLLNVRIHYANGKSHNVAVNKRIPKGTDSRIIDLPGGKRIIKKITFNYKTIPNGNGRAIVEAYGRK